MIDMIDKFNVLQFSISRLDKIITDADNKANFLLCFSIVILGGMIFVVKDLNIDCWWFKLLLILTFVSFSISSFFSFAAIFPRHKKYGNPVFQNQEDSIFFFGDIKNINADKGNDRLKKISTDSEYVYKDLVNQAKQLSLIIDLSEN